jgi:dTDP-4-dehydrorhamnose reductase
MKPKILLLGATGMLGSAFARVMSHNYETMCPVRTEKVRLPDNVNQTVLPGHKPFIEETLELADTFKPDIIINCIGVIKQKTSKVQDLELIRINATLPALLSNYCARKKNWLIHFSTDCVFDGVRGNFAEQDLPRPSDLYGLSKLVGEDVKDRALVIRTSIIGHEANTSYSLLEWFLSQENTVNGYRNAWFSGLTTVEVAKIVHQVITERPSLCGLYHLAGPKINKSELLRLISNIYNRNITVRDSSSPVIDRSLVDDRFRSNFDIPKTDWPTMLMELKKYYAS